MKRIGLISDTHSYMEADVLKYLEDVDEIWHAGDIGKISVMQKLELLGKPIIAVHGNIDHGEVKHAYPLNQRWEVEGMDVWMTHIGGYPKHYNKRVTSVFKKNPPDLFLCGHSHILRVMYDKEYNFLHANPGACGHHGFHKVRTILRFNIGDGKISKMEAIELGTRGYIGKKKKRNNSEEE